MGNKDLANSYDDNFLKLINDNFSKFKNSKNSSVANKDVFGKETHRVNFDSSNQDELREGINPFLNQFVDLQAKDPYNEIRASRQSGYEQLAKLPVRAGVKALVEVAKLPGVIGGIIQSPFVEEGEGYDTAFNNFWIKGLDDINEKINTELLPVYTKKAVAEGNLWENITSTSFWATEGADGLGFMLGMMAPGAILNKIGIGAKLLSGAKNVSEMIGIANKTEAAVSALKAMGLTSKSITIGVGAGANTILESGAEAASSGNDFELKKPEYEATNLPKILAKLDPNNSIPKTIMVPGEVYTSPDGLQHGTMPKEIPNPEYEALVVKAKEQVDLDFKNQKALLMRDVFKFNLGVLLIPNLLMSKALYGKSAAKIERTVEKTGLKALAERSGKVVDRWGKAFVSEGLIEEANQSSGQAMFSQKAMNNELSRGDDGFIKEALFGGLNDFNVNEATKAYVDTVLSVEGQKAVLLGAVLGGGMMSYSGRKEDVRKRAENNLILEGIDSSIQNYNTIFANEVYKKDEKGEYVYKKDAEGNPTTVRETIPNKVYDVAMALNFEENESKRLDEAIAIGDEKAIKKIQQAATFDLISNAIHNGESGIEALKKELKNNEKYQEIQQRDADPKNKDKSSKFTDETIAAAVYLQKQNEKFQDYAGDLINLEDPRATAENKKEYIERLNTQYLKQKHNQYLAEKKVRELEISERDIFDELDLNTAYINDDFNLKKAAGLIADDIFLQKDKVAKARLSNPTLKNITEDLEENRKEIKDIKKSVNDLWIDKTPTDKSFKDFLDAKDKLNKILNPEKAVLFQEYLTEMSDPSVITVSDLNKVKGKFKDKLGDNPMFEAVYNQFKNDIVKKEAEAEEATRASEAAEALKKQNEQNTPGDENTPDLGVINPLEEGSESIQSTNNPEVEVSGSSITEIVNEPNGTDAEFEIDENPLYSEDSTNASARIISTIGKDKDLGRDFEEFGNPLPGLESFVEFERTPRDKSKDVYSFSIGDASKEQLEIIEKIKSGKATDEEIESLSNFLPIKVTITNGKNSASSYIDSMTHSRPDIVKETTLPLRKSIIDALVVNKGDFKGIQGVFDYQFPGLLKVEDREKGDPVQKNNVFDLNEFTGMSKKEKIEYFKRNTAYVNMFGELKYTLTDEIAENQGNISELSSGEVFLKIKKADGSNFWLKLNTNTINESQANDLFELMLVKFSKFESSGKTQSNITLAELKKLIKTPSLLKEINLISKNSKLSVDETVDKLIDLLIFNSNVNQVSRFGMYFFGKTILGKGKVYRGKTGVMVGTLFNKFYSGNYSKNGKVDATILLANPEEFRQSFIEFFKYKRHNVLIKSKNFNFSNDSYIEYLLDEKNPIITTNAVVNEYDKNGKLVKQNPTFQGFSNIYLKPEVINNSKAGKAKANKASKVATKQQVVVKEEINTEDDSLNAKISELILQNEFIELSLDGKNYINKRTGKTYKRVTSVISDETVDEDDELIQSSLSIGTKIDLFVRDFFDDSLKRLSEYGLKDLGELYNLHTQLSVLRKQMEERGEIFLAKDIVLYDDTLGVAGTVDLITYTKDGFIRIYDFKTMRGNQFEDLYPEDFESKYDSTLYGDSQRSKHSKQVSLYRILLNNTNNLLAKELYIIPIEINYEPGDSDTDLINMLPLVYVDKLDTVNNAKLKEPEETVVEEKEVEIEIALDDIAVAKKYLEEVDETKAITGEYLDNLQKVDEELYFKILTYFQEEHSIPFDQLEVFNNEAIAGYLNANVGEVKKNCK